MVYRPNMFEPKRYRRLTWSIYDGFLLFMQMRRDGWELEEINDDESPAFWYTTLWSKPFPWCETLFIPADS